MMPRIISIISVTLLFGLALNANANNTFVFQGKEDQSKSIITVGHGMVRIESKDPRHPNDIMVYDGKRNVMKVIYPERKSYMEFDESTIKKQMAKAQEMQQQMMPQIMEQLENLPEDQRAIIEQRIAATQKMMQPPEKMPKMTSQDTGEVKKVGSFKCTVHATFKDGQPDGKVCLASRKALGLSKEDYQTVRGMFAFFRNMTAAIPAARDSAMRMLADAEGIPIQNDKDDGTLVKASKETLSPASFQAPADFKKVDPMTEMGMTQ